MRMKYPKPWLKTQSGSTFLRQIVETYRDLEVDSITVVLNKDFASPEWAEYLVEVAKLSKIVINHQPDWGRLFSIQLGLKSMDADHVFIHNVDNPFVNTQAIEFILSGAIANGVTIPSHKGKGGHPILISRDITNTITGDIKGYNTLKDVLLDFPRKYVDLEQNTVLININTPQDLQDLRYGSVG